MRRLSSFTNFSKMSLTACGSSRNIRHWAGEREEQETKIREDIRYFRMRKQHYPRLHSNALICCSTEHPLQRKKTFLSFIEDNRKLRRVSPKNKTCPARHRNSKAHWRSSSHSVGMSQLKWNRLTLSHVYMAYQDWQRSEKIWVTSQVVV